MSFNDEVDILGENQKAVSKLRKQEIQMNSLPVTCQSDASSIFSCFSAGHRAMMPNHRLGVSALSTKN